jgi:hypothetical protein
LLALVALAFQKAIEQHILVTGCRQAVGMARFAKDLKGKRIGVGHWVGFVFDFFLRISFVATQDA